jgi:hypothetical protein
MGLILKYNEQFLWHYLYYLLWIIGVFKNTFMLFGVEPLANESMVPCTKIGYCKVHIWAIKLHLKKRNLIYECDKSDNKGGFKWVKDTLTCSQVLS